MKHAEPPFPKRQCCATWALDSFGQCIPAGDTQSADCCVNLKGPNYDLCDLGPL